MTKKQTATPLKTLIITMQVTGRCGKSTLMTALYHWANHSGLKVAAIDCEGVGISCLSRFYPEVSVFPDAVKDLGGFQELLNTLHDLEDADMILVDMPAEKTTFLLEALQHYNAVETLRERGWQIVLPLFPSDDPKAMESCHTIVRELGDRVRYITVFNPHAKPSTRYAKNSLRNLMEQHGAPEVHIPDPTPTTLTAAKNAENKLRRKIPLSELAEHLGAFDRVEAAKWTQSMFYQFQQAALTTKELANRVEPLAAIKSTKAQAYDPFES